VRSLKLTAQKFTTGSGQFAALCESIKKQEERRLSVRRLQEATGELIFSETKYDGILTRSEAAEAEVAPRASKVRVMFLMANIVVGLLCNKKFGWKMRDFGNCELNNVQVESRSSAFGSFTHLCCTRAHLFFSLNNHIRAALKS